MLIPVVAFVMLLAGASALQAWRLPFGSEDRVRVSGEGIPEPVVADFNRTVEVRAPAEVCWEMRVADLDPHENCGPGGVALPAAFGGSGPQQAVRITKTRGAEPLTVVVHNSQIELQSTVLVNVDDSVRV